MYQTWGFLFLVTIPMKKSNMLKVLRAKSDYESYEIEKYAMNYGDFDNLVKQVERQIKNLSLGCDLHNEANHLCCFIRDYCDEKMMVNVRKEISRLTEPRNVIEKSIKKELMAKLNS